MASNPGPDKNYGTEISRLPKRPPWILVFTEFLVLAKGRDRFIKLLQYTSKLLVIIFSSKAVNSLVYEKKRLFLLKIEFVNRLKRSISEFSTFRKIIKLGDSITAWSSLKYTYKNASLTSRKLWNLIFLNELVEFLNALFDDIECLGKIGLLSKRWEFLGGKYADRAWFVAIILDLNKNFAEKQKLMSKMQYTEQSENEKIKDHEQMKWVNFSIIKLLADFGFCSIDVFELKASDALGEKHQNYWKNSKFNI